MFNYWPNHGCLQRQPCAELSFPTLTRTFSNLAQERLISWFEDHLLLISRSILIRNSNEYNFMYRVKAFWKTYFLNLITNSKGNILAFSSGTTDFHFIRLAFLNSSIKSVQEKVYLVYTQANPSFLITDMKPISTMKMSVRCVNYICANLKLREFKTARNIFK